MKVAVIGANGQLGSDICAAFRVAGETVVELNHDVVDLAARASVLRAVAACHPDVLVNTAAFHHVEKCESDPDRARSVNALGAEHAAQAAREVGAYFIHISTDYVFDGSKGAPYVETDPPAPLNVYARSKLEGERLALAAWEKTAVLRTSGLYGKNPCRGKGLNFVQLMLKLAGEGKAIRVVDHEILTPTSTTEVARQIVALAGRPLYGLCHATCEGACSWHRFAQEIFALQGVRADLSMAGPNEFPAKVPRPFYSVLENAALKGAGLNTFQPWQAALRDYLAA